jgi:hypothetical protein
MCNEDGACVAWTLNSSNECQKKKEAKYFYQKGYVSGPRSTSSSPITTTTTTKPGETEKPGETATPWWSQKSPIGGVPWWGVLLAIGVILLLMSSCSSALVLAKRSNY